MHTGKSYRLSEFLDWTRRDIYILIVLGVVPVISYQIGDLKWLGIPWTVVALLGTATAFHPPLSRLHLNYDYATMVTTS